MRIAADRDHHLIQFLMESLADKVVLVTGGSRGIGREIALALASCGCKIAVGYREHRIEADAVCDQIRSLGGSSAAFGYNVGEAGEAIALVGAVEEELGSIDVLVNNAGINKSNALQELSAEDWHETIQSNLASAFYVTQAVLKGMLDRKWGRIIMLSSIAAQTGGIIGPHYAASKAGLIGLAHSYANLLAKEGITANVIAPALIETDMIRGISSVKPSLIPVGRFGQPQEVASVVVMLASNAYITGQTINVNGGWYMS